MFNIDATIEIPQPGRFQREFIVLFIKVAYNIRWRSVL